MLVVYFVTKATYIWEFCIHANPMLVVFVTKQYYNEEKHAHTCDIYNVTLQPKK